MSDLKIRQEKMKEAKKINDYKIFLKEIVSWYPLVIYKNNNLLSLYPKTKRECPLVSTSTFENLREDYTKEGLDYDFGIDFFENFKKLYFKTPFPALFNRT
jgi:hypothetical protein